MQYWLEKFFISIEKVFYLHKEHFLKLLIYVFEGILREGIFEGNILLAETYCYNWSGRQDSNLRPSAPKAPALQFETVT